MKSILTHIIILLIGLVVGGLLTKSCQRATTVTSERITVDTIYTIDTLYQVDTVRIVAPRPEPKVIVKEVQVPVYTSEDTARHIADLDSVELLSKQVYSYDEYYEDSSYQVVGNIYYQGLINKHTQMLVIRKDNLTLIPTTRTVFTNRDIITKISSTRQPRFLAGVYVAGDKFTVQQAGITATLVDNKFRQYTIGKDILNPEAWMIQAQIPLFYSKFR